MRCDIITIFPEILDSYYNESILKRAQENNLLEIKTHNLRDYTDDKHKSVDDTPYGGGAGMVMKVEPIYKAVEDIQKRYKQYEPDTNTTKKYEEGSKGTYSTSRISSLISSRTILLSAKGKRFTQQDAQRLAAYEQLVFVCGRYEGVDERVAEHVIDEELSIGDYVLTGGELGAMVIIDAVARLLPGVLGNEQSAIHESHSTEGYREHPQYTKPEEFNGWKVPEVLLSGHHEEIAKWRKAH